MRKLGWVLVAIVVFASAAPAHALDAQQKCLAGRSKAKAAYDSCVEKVFAKVPGATQIGGKDFEKLLKCVSKYDATWPKLAKLSDSASCGGLERFQDNGETVTDRLTLLTWEKKTSDADFNPNPGDVHDPDNGYALTFNDDDDGDVYSTFLAALNAGTGFADASSWRVPTFAEFLTIRGRSELGFSSPGLYWTAKDDQAASGQAWRVHVIDSFALSTGKIFVNNVRAVRGGL